MEVVVKGIVKAIGATQVVSEKFKKRDFSIETMENYPQYLTMQMTQDKCDFLNGYAVGQQVECKINLKGRAYEKDGITRGFNTLECWFISKDEAQAPTPVASEPVKEDLPF